MKQRKKQDFPTKVCVVCERPFSWRKKWAEDWEHVKYCSKSCRANKNDNNRIKINE
ncbi:MAG: DUF2256 domain-containing protein [Chitinophagales bacterium]